MKMIASAIIFLNFLMVATALRFADQQDCTALSSCPHKEKLQPSGTVLEILPEKCLKIICVNGSATPRLYHGEKTCGCCEFRGALYPPGKVFLAGCVKMACEDGRWKPSGEIEKRCKQCEVFNDPHFFSYDRHRFDYHGDCKYALTQKGTSVTPDYGVFAQFQRCYGLPSCIHTTTFKDNPKLVIELAQSGLAPPNIFKILVNGQDYVVPEGSYAYRITDGGKPQDVLAWRQGDCLRMLGSQGLFIQVCKHRIDLWSHPYLGTNLCGLCGSPDNLASNDFTARNNQEYTLQFMAPEDFASSWKTVDQASPACTGGGRPGTGGGRPGTSSTTEAEKRLRTCQKDRRSWRNLSMQCDEAVNSIEVNGQKAGKELNGSLVEACAFDLCMITKGSQNPKEEIKTWLGEVQKMTKERVFIQTMVAVCDPEAGECVDLPPSTTEPPTSTTACASFDCEIDIIFNPFT